MNREWRQERAWGGHVEGFPCTSVVNAQLLSIVADELLPLTDRSLRFDSFVVRKLQKHRDRSYDRFLRTSPTAKPAFVQSRRSLHLSDYVDRASVLRTSWRRCAEALLSRVEGETQRRDAHAICIHLSLGDGGSDRFLHVRVAFYRTRCPELHMVREKPPEKVAMNNAK